jgi:hypothetical protein
LNLIRLLLLVSLTSCGYHFGHSPLSKEHTTISLPYVEGDFNGNLTSAIAHAIVQSGAYEYRSSDGELTLLAKIVDINDTNIGFRYDRKKRGKLENTIIPAETRLKLTVEITLVEAISGKVLVPPVRLSSSVDFDHEYNYSRRGVNIFSLGQLTDADAALEAAWRPLNKLMAQKIVDYICDTW